MALATLTIDINARLANIERDLGKAAHIAEKNGKKMEAAFAGAKAAFIGLGAALGAGTILSGIKTVIDGADQLQKASQKYGIAVEQLSALKYAGELSDVSLEAIGNGLKKLSVNMLDTAAGTGEAKDAFKALGLSVTAASGGLKSSDQVLAEISDKFAGMEDGAGKTAIAVKLFGRAGADLIPLLNQGSKGLADMNKEAEQLGAIVGGDLTRKSEEFNDNLTRLSRTFDAFKVSLAGSILPDLVKFTGTLVEATKASGGLLKGIEMILSLPVAGSVYDNFDAIKKELENIDRKIAEMEAKPFFLRGLNLSGLKKNREELEQQLKFVESIIHQRGGGKEVFDFGPAVWASKTKSPDLPNDNALKALKKAADEARQAMAAAAQTAYDNALAAAEADAQIEKLRNSYVDMVEPAAQAMRELRKFDEIAPALGLTAEQLERIRDTLQEKIDFEQYGKPLKDITEEVQRQGDLARDLGMTFQSAFEDAIVSGKHFQDVLQGLAQDLLRIFVRKAFTSLIGSLFGGPAGGAGAGFFGGLNLPSFDVGTRYVPRDMIAQVHRGEAIIPAEFNRPGALAAPVSITINNTLDGATGAITHDGRNNAAELAQRINTAVRGVLLDEKRPGGLLST
jgi:hypothetical protein